MQPGASEFPALLKPTSRSLVRNWWPVVVWLGVIRLESTDLASASNTTGLLYKLISLVLPHADPVFVDHLDEVLRKTGHFIGYAILSALVFLALQKTNRDRFREVLRRPWGTYLRDLWRPEWCCIGILATIATAAADEIHQSFIPSRTGRWQDVVIDTCGAAVVQLIIYVFATRKLKQTPTPTSQPELSSTR
jgi:VanZ family protein